MTEMAKNELIEGEEMNEPKYSEENQYENFASEYSGYKQTSILNIIKCGEIIYKAKQQLDHGMFERWLMDQRVGESLRTGQRLMSIYKNYRHLLDESDKIEPISHLGVLGLLTLKDLPQRFKKSVTVHNDDGHDEIVDVVDTEKVSEFMNKAVSVDGKVKIVKNLSIPEMKKQIREIAGEYKDLGGSEEVSAVEEKKVEKPLPSFYFPYTECKDFLEKFDETLKYELPSDKIAEYKKQMLGMKANMVSLIMLIDQKVDLLS